MTNETIKSIKNFLPNYVFICFEKQMIFFAEVVIQIHCLLLCLELLLNIF